MKLTLREVEYRADLADLYRLSIAEARTIKRRTGMTIADWRVGLMTLVREDPDVLAGLVFLLRHRARSDADPEVDWDDIGTLTIEELAEGFEWEASDTEAVNRAQEQINAAVIETAEGFLRAGGPGSDDPPAEPPEGAPPAT